MRAAKQHKHLYSLSISANHCRGSYFVFLMFSSSLFFVVALNEEFSWISVQDSNLISVHCSTEGALVIGASLEISCILYRNFCTWLILLVFSTLCWNVHRFCLSSKSFSVSTILLLTLHEFRLTFPNLLSFEMLTNVSILLVFFLCHSSSI